MGLIPDLLDAPFRHRTTAAVLATTLAIAGCGASAGSTASTKPRGACPTRPVPVVVSVDQWGDIVGRLAGDCGDVTTVFRSSAADPHDYEPTPADSARFEGARLVVINGLGYDSWATKAVDALDTRPVIVNAGKLAGGSDGDNPHVWYDPVSVYRVAAGVTAALGRLEPSDAAYFAGRHAAWVRSMQPYEAAIARARRADAHKTYGATENVFDDMAAAVGLRDRTPRGFRRAAANESDPSPGDLDAFERALGRGSMSLLVVNTQTEGSIPSRIRARAEAEHLPVLEVTESVPPGARSFESWQVAQLDALTKALGR
jgi:zinc/manganese transport system substrate-binding protein